MGYQGCTRAVGGIGTWVGGQSAEGVVTSIRERPGRSPPARTRLRESSVITFTTAKGEVVTFEHPVQSMPAPYAQNEHVRVVYDADASQDAVVPGGLALLSLMWALLGMAGLVLMLTGPALLLIGALPWGLQPRAGITAASAESPLHGAVQRFARDVAVVIKGARR